MANIDVLVDHTGPFFSVADAPTGTIIASLGSGLFTTGNRYLIIAHASVTSPDSTQEHELRFGGVSDPRHAMQYRGPATGSYSQTAFTMGLWTAVAGQGIDWYCAKKLKVGNPQSRVLDVSLIAIDLDSVGFSSSDWNINEDSTTLSNMDNVYSNNLGASITFTPDGISDYLIIGGGNFGPNASTSNLDTAGMQLYDSIDGQLCEQVLNNNVFGFGSAEEYGHSALWVLDSPPATSRTETLRFTGSNVWDHKFSCLFILRLDAFKSHVFSQDIKGTNFPVQDNILQTADYTAIFGEALIFGRTAFDVNTSNNEKGITRLFYDAVEITESGFNTCTGTFGTYSPVAMFSSRKLTSLTGTKTTTLNYEPQLLRTNQIVNENCLVMFDLGLKTLETESFKFTTETDTFGSPETFTESNFLTTLPSGWTTQASGTGSAPTFSGAGMLTNPGSNGASYIEKTGFGLDFDIGFLFDLIPRVNVSGGKLKILEAYKGGEGLVSVGLNFDTQEVWLSSVKGEVGTGFRPGTADGSTPGDTFLRLTIKGVGDDLIARLFVGSPLLSSNTPVLLQQTLGPSVSLGTTEDYVRFGSIDTGDNDVLIIIYAFLSPGDPDPYYPFININDFTPPTSDINGGDTILVNLDNTTLNINAGSEDFNDDNFIIDESIGSANTSVGSGQADLNLTGIGTAALRFMNALSGGMPSGADISVDVSADSSVITNPRTTNDAILAALEYKATGFSVALELVSNISAGAFFRVVDSSGSVTRISRVTAGDHNLRIIRADTQLIVVLNGIQVYEAKFRTGVGIVRLYAESINAITTTTTFTNFTVSPVVMIGNKVAF